MLFVGQNPHSLAELPVVNPASIVFPLSVDSTLEFFKGI
jgi:hypothetical protein